jgi:hypothetical protein
MRSRKEICLTTGGQSEVVDLKNINFKNITGKRFDLEWAALFSRDLGYEHIGRTFPHKCWKRSALLL